MLWIQPNLFDSVKSDDDDVGQLYCRIGTFLLCGYLACQDTLMIWRAVLVASDTRFFWVLVPLYGLIVSTASSSTAAAGDNGLVSPSSKGFECRISPPLFAVTFAFVLVNIVVCSVVVHRHLPGGVFSPQALTMRLLALTVSNFVTAFNYVAAFVLNTVVGLSDTFRIVLGMVSVDMAVFVIVVGFVLRNRARSIAGMRPSSN